MVAYGTVLTLASLTVSAAGLAVNVSLETSTSVVSPFKLIHKHQGKDFLDERLVQLVSPSSIYR